MRIADVNTSLWLGAFLAVLIVFLFLHNIRGTFIVAIAIPTSIVATFIPIWFAGFTMNSMVMLALSLAVGILVDDSIVVLENIYRHLAKGEAPAGRGTQRPVRDRPGGHHDHHGGRGRLRADRVHGRHRRSVLQAVRYHGCT